MLVCRSLLSKRKLDVGDVIHVSVDLQFVVGRIESIGDSMIVNWDSPLYIRKEKPPVVFVAQLDSNLESWVAQLSFGTNNYPAKRA